MHKHPCLYICTHRSHAYMHVCTTLTQHVYIWTHATACLYHTSHLHVCAHVWWSESESHSLLSLCDPMDNSLPGSSVHGILQAWILEWVAISSFRGSSQPWDWTQVSRIAGRFFTIWATREVTQACSHTITHHGYTHAHTRQLIKGGCLGRETRPPEVNSCFLSS